MKTAFSSAIGLLVALLACPAVLGQLSAITNYGAASGSGLYGMGGQTSFLGNGYNGFGGSAYAGASPSNVWNAATMAFRSILTIPSSLTRSFLQNQQTATVLSSLPDLQASSGNELQALVQSFSVSTQQTLQKYIDAVTDPNLSKSTLAATISQLSKESSDFGSQINAALVKEGNDWTAFNSAVQSISDLAPIVRNITATRNNNNLNLGEEVLNLINYLISLPSQLQYALCQQVDKLASGVPQFTTRGLATLATTCQALERMYSNQGSLTGFASPSGGSTGNFNPYPGSYSASGMGGSYPGFGGLPGMSSYPGGFSSGSNPYSPFGGAFPSSFGNSGAYPYSSGSSTSYNPFSSYTNLGGSNRYPSGSSRYSNTLGSSASYPYYGSQNSYTNTGTGIYGSSGLNNNNGYSSTNPFGNSFNGYSGGSGLNNNNGYNSLYPYPGNGNRYPNSLGSGSTNLFGNSFNGYSGSYGGSSGLNNNGGYNSNSLYPYSSSSSNNNRYPYSNTWTGSSNNNNMYPYGSSSINQQRPWGSSSTFNNPSGIATYGNSLSQPSFGK